MKKIANLFLIFAGLASLGACERAVLDQPPSSKKDVFNFLWKSIDERYSFFEMKHIDWDSVYTVYEPKITETMSEEAFFDTLSLLIDELRDGHSGINSFNNGHQNVCFFFNSPENFNERIITDFYFKGYGNRTGAFQHAHIRHRNIGYIYYGSFSEDVTDEDMEYILDYYSDAMGLIIDVRNNFGGTVENVYDIACHFTNEPVTVLGSQIKIGPGHEDFTNITYTTIEPRGTFWTKPVIVLTNRKTYSAGSIFSLVMSQMPSVMVVGDTTGGGLGLPIGTELPNGWQMHCAGSRILSPEGVCYELGVPPDVQQNMDPEQGYDDIIEKAADIIMFGNYRD